MAVKSKTGFDADNQRVRNVASPSASTDAANKQYVDDNLAGLSWKQPVRVATTANGTLASAFANGQTVDGVSLATGDRILLKDQTAQTENGIYVVAASGAPTRASDANSSAELDSATVFVLAGTVNADKAYTQTTNTPTIGSSNIVFAQFGGGASYTADGQGIELSGTTFALELDGTTLAKSASGVRVGSGAAGAGLTESSGVLAVGAGTGISVAADAVAIDTSVVARKFSQAIGDNSATAITVTHNLGTRDLVASVVEAATPWNVVLCDITHPTTNTTTFTFATAPASSEFRVTIVG